jgi:hypothetical protein
VEFGAFPRLTLEDVTYVLGEDVITGCVSLSLALHLIPFEWNRSETAASWAASLSCLHQMIQTREHLYRRKLIEVSTENELNTSERTF